MGSIGMKVSQKGYDVKTCADRFLTFSSSFPCLKIFNTYSVTTTKPASGTNTITINHNLGYFAPFIIIYNGSTSRGTDESFYFSRGLNYGVPIYSKITNRQYVNKLEIDVEDDFDDSGTNSGDTVYFTVYQFIDDFSTISESTIETGTTKDNESANYGIKSSKTGEDVKEADDIDLNFSSSFFTQIIHKKGIHSGLGTVSHNLGYYPNFLCYIQNSGNNYISYNPFLVKITDEDLDPGTLASDNGYYIIFKDKLI
jgi:hypothetical protein